MGDPDRDVLHGLAHRFQRMMGDVIALEAAKERFDQAIGLGTAARRVAGDQIQLMEELLQGLGNELRAVVGEELQAFGQVSLQGEALEQCFAQELANILGEKSGL